MVFIIVLGFPFAFLLSSYQYFVQTEWNKGIYIYIYIYMYI